MDPKELKKLAKACRDAGIRHYKDANIEFTLDDSAPPPSAYKRAKGAVDASPDQIESDALSPEDLLLWSVGGIPINEQAS